jgi:hypothetical protein
MAFARMLAISSSRSSVVIVWGWVWFIIEHHFVKVLMPIILKQQHW